MTKPKIENLEVQPQSLCRWESVDRDPTARNFKVMFDLVNNITLIASLFRSNDSEGTHFAAQ